MDEHLTPDRGTAYVLGTLTAPERAAIDAHAAACPACAARIEAERADAARIALSTAMRHLSAHPGIALVRFVLFGEQALREYEAALADLASDDPIEGS